MGSADENTELKATLIEAKYESFLFMDQDTLIQRLKEAAPHIVLFSSGGLMTPMSDFVEQVLNENPEVQFIYVGSLEDTAALKDYREFNLAGLVPHGPELGYRCLWQIDQVCDNLLRTYQGEKLLDEKKKIQENAQASVRDLEQRLQQTQSELQKKLNQSQSDFSLLKSAAESLLNLPDAFSYYDQILSLEDLTQAFYKRIQCPAIYFKFLPTVNSFVGTSAYGISFDHVQGVGFKLNKEELRDPITYFKSGRTSQALQEVMKEGFQVQNFVTKPVFLQNGLDGVFVFWGSEDFDFKKVENEFLLFILFYQRAFLARQVQALEVLDPVSELHNRKYFYQKLEEEISRARRLKKPVSVVRIGIDHLTEIEQSLGEHQKEMVLKTVATIIKRTSRVNDISCRTSDQQVSLILPHCSRRGAALRAERLRRIVEAHIFSTIELKVSISCGVSEYPSLSQNALDLDATATQALDFIVEKGGNKVCLFKPQAEFQPEFEVTP